MLAGFINQCGICWIHQSNWMSSVCLIHSQNSSRILINWSSQHAILVNYVLLGYWFHQSGASNFIKLHSSLSLLFSLLCLPHSPSDFWLQFSILIQFAVYLIEVDWRHSIKFIKLKTTAIELRMELISQKWKDKLCSSHSCRKFN